LDPSDVAMFHRPSDRGGNMTSGYTQYILMAIFFGVIAFIPAAWFVLGLKSYGTGDYHQP
jgi:hypothetical protein